MFVAAIILALFFWAYFADVKSITAALLVGEGAAILAGASFAIAFVSYLWTPKKYIFWTSLAAFSLLVITTATLILGTGGTSSPFISLWMIVSVFAGVFGIYGIAPLFAAVTAYLLLQFAGGTLSREAILTVVLAGELPLGVSYLIWHTKSAAEDKGDRAYRELASELSQVAGKSEVVINAIADGVIALDNQGIIQLINPAAQRIIGWGKQDAMNLDYKSVLKLVDKKDAELQPSTDPVTQALATNKLVTTNELSLMTNSGKKLLVSVVVSPVGQMGSGVIVVFRDITKEKAEEREQAEFISTASHEMRTPVASIEGYLGLALNPATAQIDEKARDFIQKAHESAQHLGRLFQDLLDVSKAEDNRLSNNPKAVDVVEFSHDIVEGLRPKAEEKGLRILFKPQPDDDDKSGERRINPVFYVNVDNDHLREVIANLVENAIKYTPKGTVTIDVGGDNDHVVISIADSGIGIPAEDMAHLFQKFYRVDNSATREIGGTGLGLYLCRRLTEAMNGRIWAESQYQQGSTFYVELPRISHEEAMRLIEEASIQAEEAQKEEVTPIQPLPQQSILPETPQTPEVAQPVPMQPANEAAFASPPVNAVVEQLQTIYTPAAPQPQSQQQPQLQPEPQPPQPQVPQQPVYQQPAPYTATRPTQYPQPNIPLSSIERNPGQYMRARGDTAVPPRNQN